MSSSTSTPGVRELSTSPRCCLTSRTTQWRGRASYELGDSYVRSPFPDPARARGVRCPLRRRTASHRGAAAPRAGAASTRVGGGLRAAVQDRKSTRLNSSHGYISYAVFCLKKKKKRQFHHHSDQ